MPRNNLNQELPIEQLAEAARLSMRQFSRAFKAETGQSHAQGCRASQGRSGAADA